MPNPPEQSAAPFCAPVFTHVGEILQIPWPRQNGSGFTPALVTLPCQGAFAARARFSPAPDCHTVQVLPKNRLFARRLARRLLEQADGSIPGGILELASDIPLCRGAGSSTADCLATARAIARVLGTEFDPEWLMATIWSIEKASDPLVFTNAGECVLYSSREGRVLRRYRQPLPPFAAIGFHTSFRRIRTHKIVADYSPAQHRQGCRILNSFEEALAANDAGGIARAATASAELNQPHLQIARFEAFLQETQSVGALGLAIAHSGTLAAWLFAADDRDLTEKQEMAGRRILEIGGHQPFAFQTAVP